MAKRIVSLISVVMVLTLSGCVLAPHHGSNGHGHDHHNGKGHGHHKGHGKH